MIHHECSTNFFFQVGEDAEVTRNDSSDDQFTGRNDGSLEDKIEKYVKSHDVTIKLPVGSVKLGAKNLDNDELDIKFNFGEENGVSARGKEIYMLFYLAITISYFRL